MNAFLTLLLAGCAAMLGGCYDPLTYGFANRTRGPVTVVSTVGPGQVARERLLPGQVQPPGFGWPYPFVVVNERGQVLADSRQLRPRGGETIAIREPEPGDFATPPPASR